MRGRKRKLDTREETDRVCFLYYKTDSNEAQIARHFNVSAGVISRVLKENGSEYIKREKETSNAN